MRTPIHQLLCAISYSILLPLWSGCGPTTADIRKPDPRANVHYQEAVNLRKAGNLQEALIESDRAIDLNPQLAEAYEVRGQILCNLARYREAIEVFTKLIQLTSPNNIDAYRRRAEAYIAIGELRTGAYGDLTVAIRQDPTNPELYLLRSQLFSRVGSTEEAVADCTRAIELDDDNARYYAARGLAHCDSGNVDRALADFDRAAARDPNCTLVYMGRGLCYAATNDDEAALQAFTKASEINPQHVSAHYERGRTLARLKRYDEAIMAFERGIAIQPGDPELHIQRALAHLATGDDRTANAGFAEACRLLQWVVPPNERTDRTIDCD